MKRDHFKWLVACAVLVWLALSAAAQQGEERRRADLSPIELAGGSRIEFKSFNSESLGQEQPYSIFFPPSYSREKKEYPVIYFLHGLNNDHTSWTVDRYGSLQEKLEQMIEKKEVPEFLLVSPKGDNSFYTNYVNGGKKYEDYLTKDLLQHIESTYRAQKGRKNRAIAGTSMGGYGALKAAFKHPDLYAATAGHSPIIFLGKNPLDVLEPARNSRMFQYFSSMLGAIYGDPIDQAHWDQNNLLLLGKQNHLQDLKILFDYGTGDRYNQSIRLGEGLKELDRVLTEAKVEHVFREYPNEPHGWVLVNNHIHESVPFLTQTFKKQ